MKTTLRWILFIFVFSYRSNLFGEIYIDTNGHCNEISDSIKAEVGKEESALRSGVDELSYQPELFRYYLFGAGVGYFGKKDIKEEYFEVFGGYLWQVNQVLSFGVTGEYFSESFKTKLFGLSFSAVYYPFEFIVIPFGSLNLGPGLFHSEKRNHFGLISGLEFGGIVSRLLPLVFMISGKLTMFMNDTPLPYAYNLRLGIMF